MPYCQDCGTEITEQEYIEHNGRCINCLKPQSIDKVNKKKPPCYICGESFVANCNICGLPLCSAHVKERNSFSSGSPVTEKLCPNCVKQNRPWGKIIQIVLIAAIMVVFLLVLPFLHK
jgi:hypothetical protein